MAIATKNSPTCPCTIRAAKHFRSTGKSSIASSDKAISQTILPESPLSLADLQLDKVKINDSVATVKQKLGKPIDSQSKGNQLYLKYKTVEIGFVDGLVHDIVSTDNTAITPRQLHAGLDYSDMTAAYGYKFNKTLYGEMLLYEYKVTDAGADYIIRFALKDGKPISYISIRKL